MDKQLHEMIINQLCADGHDDLAHSATHLFENYDSQLTEKDKQIAEESKRADFWQKEQLKVREANLKLLEQITELTKRLDSVARIIDSDVSGGPYEYDPLKVKWLGEYRSFKAGDTK